MLLYLINKHMTVGKKYTRNEIIGPGVAGLQLVFNTFQISLVTNKHIHIYGKIASGCNSSRKINKQDFETFLKNYHENK